ncbi:MAG: hypothetical protein HFACDABA_02335 [Anaerolineales bacterium]|nr:hypothetical protein [Anaerolineales bacterium]
MLYRKIFIVLAAVSLLLTACGAQQSAETTEVKITLTEFGIQSSLTEFKVGVPYHFVVTNAGAVEHEFMVMPPLKEDQMGMGMDMHELDEQALAMVPASDLPAGATATFDYTFTEAAPAGTLEFACHTPGHYEANMKLPITVK